MTGGFVGVDVFFVISGFLISSIIVRELDADTFSLTSFYERRVRRIVPALTVVLAITTLAGFQILYPNAYVGYAKSLLAACASASNFYFWQRAGYFEAPAYTQPLLHTWSLAVEEQFYLVFPLFLLAVRRLLPNWRRLLVGIVFVASFVAGAAGAFKLPTATFFLPFGRAWELLLGVLVALGGFPRPKRVASQNVLAALGLALIGGSIVFVSPDRPFPGLAALPSCLGAALVIAADTGKRGLVGWALSLRPLVFIGLISYSLYLWHWPIIVLWEQRSGSLGASGLTAAQKLGVVAISMVLATCSWRYVERPFRRSSAPRRRVFVVAAIVTAGLATAAGGVVLTNGLPSRFSPAILRLAAFLDGSTQPDFQDGRCFLTSRNEFRDFDQPGCLRERPGVPNVLLVGDSHAAHLMYGLTRALPNVNVQQANASGCRPTIERGEDDKPWCAALNDFLFREYLPQHKPDLLILSARWKKAELAGVSKTLDWLNARQIRVLLVGPVVEYSGALPQLLALGLATHDEQYPRSHMVDERRQLDATLLQLSRQKSIAYASTYRALCSTDACRYVAANGAPLQFDYGHLTHEGSLFVAREFVRQGMFDLPPRQ